MLLLQILSFLLYSFMHALTYCLIKFLSVLVSQCFRLVLHILSSLCAALKKIKMRYCLLVCTCTYLVYVVVGHIN